MSAGVMIFEVADGQLVEVDLRGFTRSWFSRDWFNEARRLDGWYFIPEDRTKAGPGPYGPYSTKDLAVTIADRKLR